MMSEDTVWDGISHPFTAYKVGNDYFLQKQCASEKSLQCGDPIEVVTLYQMYPNGDKRNVGVG